MSGGSLDYIYWKVEDVADLIKERATNQTHKDFAEHLYKVSKALKALEWEWSGDTSDGDADDEINELLKKD